MFKIPNTFQHLATAGLLLWSAHAAAVPILSASARAACSTGGMEVSGGPFLPVATASCTGANAIGDNRGEARAVVTPKKVSVRTKSEGSADTPPGSPVFPLGANSRASGSASDTFVLTVVDPFGAPLMNPPFGNGTFTALIGASGFAIALGDENAIADIAWNVTVGSQSGGGSFTVASTGFSRGAPPVPIPLVVPWTFGHSIPVRMSANAAANAAAANGFALAEADFSGTLEWLGITEVRNALGNPVEHFTAVGSSGINWATGVEVVALPEPPTVLLITAALLALGIRKRWIAFLMRGHTQHA